MDQSLKKRLKSVNNINQITKAMELVAATKMRKSQEIALASRPYAFLALGLLANVSRLEIPLPALLLKRKVKKTIFLLVASDKGLAGSFNALLFKKFESFIKDKNITDKNSLFAAVGEKSRNYLTKKGLKIVENFIKVGDFTTPEETEPVANFLAQGFLGKKWDRVIIFSTNFRSALKQEPLMREILPIDFEKIKQTVKEIIPETGKFADLIKESKIDLSLQFDKPQDYTIEPSSEKMLEEIVWHLFRMQVYHLILEANASEHAARRMAMKNASDNAKELADNLSLQYNKSRQSTITKELIEITAGSQSLL